MLVTSHSAHDGLMSLVNPPWQCRTRANSEAKSKHALVGYKTSPSFNVTSSNRMHYIGYLFLPAYVFPFNSCNGIPKHPLSQAIWPSFHQKLHRLYHHTRSPCSTPSGTKCLDIPGPSRGRHICRYLRAGTIRNHPAHVNPDPRKTEIGVCEKGLI
jgi:hypothetical protein